MKKLSCRQIILLHQQLIVASGGTPGVRDEGLLESAVLAPFQEFAGVAKYNTLVEKAARLGFGIIKNHPFLDGNKRTGTHAMLTMLSLNGNELEYTQKELIAIILAVAAGETDYDGLLEWLYNHEI